MNLLKLLPPTINSNQHYVVWLDNLFTSTTLLSYLKELGYGAAGTCRANSGIHKDFVEAQKREKSSGQRLTKWGTIYQQPTMDNVVLQTSWKDSSLVLFMTTVHSPVELDPDVIQLQQVNTKPGQLIGNQMIVANRKMVKTTSSAYKTHQAVFGNSFRKNLAIPLLVSEYNYGHGHVDTADHLRANSKGERAIRRGGWHALWRFLYNTVLDRKSVV